ncbi:MAG TPA: hypothetical protein VEP72_02530 [Microbacterium sp.]|nr:hypothetical protein [Microbacterium sp.]
MSEEPASGPAPRGDDRVPAKRPAYEPAVRLLRPMRYDPSMPRPAAIMAGVGLLAVKVLAGLLVLMAAAVSPETVIGADVDDVATSTILFVGIAGVVLLIDALLATFIWFGRNWARVVVMIGGVLSISSLFVAWWDQGQEITLPNDGLIPLGLDVLVLLALSSRDAAAYARRNERR